VAVGGLRLRPWISLAGASLFPNAQLMVVGPPHGARRGGFILQDFSSYGADVDRGGDFRLRRQVHASGGELRLDREFHFPDSIGDLYSRVTVARLYATRR